jgi:cytochrome b6-f complex iron-sulfur subunit
MSETVNQRMDGMLNQPVGRRGLFKYALLGFSVLATAVGTLYPIISYLWPPKQKGSSGASRVAVATVADLPPGKGQVFSVNNKPVIVINTPDGYAALSATCTHLGCIVTWNEQKQVITCPCHEAFFNTNGVVISGPPPSPLPQLRVQVEGDQIYVEGGES